MISHKRKVEKFYSHGANLRSMQEGGFLSFGLWREDTADYRQAAENLLNMLLENEKILHRGRILNVACGYGSETWFLGWAFRRGALDYVFLRAVREQ